MTQDPLASELDALFQLHPAAVVEARNALSLKLRQQGRKEDAARIKSIPRPSAAAWALNRLFFEQPQVLERARQEAARVRSLHADDQVDPNLLREAMATQRAAVTSVVAAAERYCAEAKLPYGGAHQRKLLATVQAWLAGHAAEAPGRMTHDAEPVGFDAVQVVGASSPMASREAAVVVPPRAKEPAKKVPSAEVIDARRVLEQLEREAAKAREVLKRAEAERESHETALQKLMVRVEAAERALDELRQQAQRAREVLLASDSAHAQATHTRVHSEAQVNDARRVLEALEAES